MNIHIDRLRKELTVIYLTCKKIRQTRHYFDIMWIVRVTFDYKRSDQSILSLYQESDAVNSQKNIPVVRRITCHYVYSQ